MMTRSPDRLAPARCYCQVAIFLDHNAVQRPRDVAASELRARIFDGDPKGSPVVNAMGARRT